MRPEYLAVEGFASFRNRAELDLAAADLFALAGATGAGKSSLLDAICFALYGRIPRLGDRDVAPLVSAGRQEAKVRLDFTVSGAPWSIERSVRLQGPKRRVTPKVVVHEGDDLRADSVGTASTVIEELLGLRAEDFTRCVVLPQGAFAQFLHDSGANRQDLLVRLLGLGVYDRVRVTAEERARRAANEANQLQGRLDNELSGVDADSVRSAGDEAKRLSEAASKAVQADAAFERGEAARRWVSVLGALSPPTGLDETGAAMQSARDAVTAAERGEEEASAAVDAAEKALVDLGDRDALVHLMRLHDEQVRATATRSGLEANAARASKTAERATAAYDEARAARDAAVAELETVRQANRAHALAVDLVEGAPCPVCKQPVGALPDHEEPPEFDEANRAAVEAKAAADDAEKQARAAEAKRVEAQASLDTLDRQLAARSLELGGSEREEIEAELAAITAADHALRAAREAQSDANRRVASARQSLDDAIASERDARSAFDRARDTVAALGPPDASRLDLAADWAALLDWSQAQAVEQAKIADESETERRAVAEELSATGVAVDASRPLGPQATEAAARAAAQAERLAGLLEAAEQARARLGEVTTDHQVADSLGRHLRADRFERWLVDEAMEELLIGATDTLLDLSDGAYSLALTDDRYRDFAVIDHRNADERRSVRTLSGGETFLASLALALALADKVAALAPGLVRLESLFLDEGFGTLDPDTLDVVAGAIEQLGAGGRLVGVVTHVAELAERLPVRFRVRKTPDGSTVEREVA